jgi:hypothetical protein
MRNQTFAVIFVLFLQCFHILNNTLAEDVQIFSSKSPHQLSHNYKYEGHCTIAKDKSGKLNTLKISIYGESFTYGIYYEIQFQEGSKPVGTLALPGMVCEIKDVDQKKVTLTPSSNFKQTELIIPINDSNSHIGNRKINVSPSDLSITKDVCTASVVIGKLRIIDTKLKKLVEVVEHSDSFESQKVTTGDILWVGNNGYKVLNIVPPDPDKHVIGWVDISKEPVEVKK